MKISSHDIRSKTFNTKFLGGLDPVEVSAFLGSLATAWDRLLEENRELKQRLDVVEPEAQQFKEYQMTLLSTINNTKTQQQEILEKAKSDAEQVVRDATMTADAIKTKAEWTSKTLKEESEQFARNTYKELKMHVSSLQNEYNSILHMRELLLKELRGFTLEITNRVDRLENKPLTDILSIPQPTGRLGESIADAVEQTAQEQAQEQTNTQAEEQAKQAANNRPYSRQASTTKQAKVAAAPKPVASVKVEPKPLAPIPPVEPVEETPADPIASVETVDEHFVSQAVADKITAIAEPENEEQPEVQSQVQSIQQETEASSLFVLDTEAYAQAKQSVPTHQLFEEPQDEQSVKKPAASSGSFFDTFDE